MVDQGPCWLSPAHCKGRKERGGQKGWAGRQNGGGERGGLESKERKENNIP